MSVSFDGGKTWHPATVTGHGGSYTAAFTAPAGAKVSLRTSAADAAGGSVTETITGAYQTSPDRPGQARRLARGHVPIPRPGSSQMRISRIAIAAGAALTAVGTLTAAVPGAATAGTLPTPAARAACPAARPGQVRCLTLYAPQTAVNAGDRGEGGGPAGAARSTTPKGWGATSIESAYKLPLTKGAGQTIGIVDAFSTPHLASRPGRVPQGVRAAAVHDRQRLPADRQPARQGVPAAAPPIPLGWGVEETLDVSMVSAACPLCKIIVVEAKSPLRASLAAAEDTAARLGAQVISNSYGGRESGFTQAHAKAYHHPGHVIVASVRRRRLHRGACSRRTWPTSPRPAAPSWPGPRTPAAGRSRSGTTASAPPAAAAPPTWPSRPGSTTRTAPAGRSPTWPRWPRTSPSTTARYPKQLGGPWLTVSGTSAAAPLIAAVYGLAGNAATIKPGYEYAHAGALFDVTKGNNDWFNQAHGASCGYDYLCVAKKGYDGPTGLGTPDGTGAF